MKITLDLPDYSPETGIRTQWEQSFSIATSGTTGCFTLKANKAGLVSLAMHLLTLAQDNVPDGCHIHYDEFNSLEDNSIEFVIQKTS
ncbi:MAG TPA: hypothetical protein VFO93_01320 [Hymenobacter sp.]|uniref:Imm32 family immunity protein n=1 Tax=Hymenobacter sp. TaxID=1898978 RepID=UPI002D810329|nr:hypothetical protein [Hymenobacter sp.]HET9502150.1 hypothetical protein [Hymenobacter sp.]